MSGKTARVIRAFNINIVPRLSIIAVSVRKVEGSRSEPKYEISSMGSVSGYIEAPTGVPSW